MERSGAQWPERPEPRVETVRNTLPAASSSSAACNAASTTQTLPVGPTANATIADAPAGISGDSSTREVDANLRSSLVQWQDCR